MGANPKPPLGVTPRAVWLHARRVELREAIERYLAADLAVPPEWVTEWNQSEWNQSEDTARHCKECDALLGFVATYQLVLSNGTLLKPLCQTCYERLRYTCASCQVPVSSEARSRAAARGYRPLCDTCLQDAEERRRRQL